MDVSFGAAMPTGWNLDLASFDGAAAKWQRAVEIGCFIEELGFDSLWIADHVYTVPRPEPEGVFDCWATLAAMSQLTKRVALGQMVSYHGFRPPALMAKITSTIDVMSGGRLIWGVGAGWYKRECIGYGYDFPPAKVRCERVAECVEIVRSMWTEPETTYEGKHYRVVRARCDPKPLQAPTPPILIGGGGEKTTLRTVAQLADWSNFLGDAEVWAHKREVLKGHCAAIGRDEDEIRKTWSPQMLIRETEAEILAEGPRYLRDGVTGSFDMWRAASLVGTLEQVSEKIERYIALGCSYVIPYPADYPSTESLELLAREVIPNFR